MPVINRIPMIGTFFGVLILSAALTFALTNPTEPAHAQTVSAEVATPVAARAQLDLFIQRDCDHAQCGLSGNGGEHFWVIASYAAIIDYAIIPGIEAACDSAGPELGEVCDTLGDGIKELVEHVRALTNEGVWGSVYLSPTYKGKRVQSGRYA